MTNYSAGSASIDIGSNLHNFHRDVRAKVESEDVSFFVDVLPDMTGFATEVNTRLDAIDAEFYVDVLPDMTGFAREVDNRLAAINAEFFVDVRPDMSGFASELDTRLATITGEIDIEPNVDLTGFGQALQARLDLLDLHVDVDVRLFDAVAATRLDILTRDRTIDVDVRVDRNMLNQLGNLGGGAGGGLGGSISGLGGASSSATGGLTSMALILGAIVTIAPLVIGAIGSIGVGIAALGTVAGPALGGLLTGLSGVGEAFSAAGAAADSAGEDVEASAKAQESALRSLGLAQRNLQDAVKDETRAREDVIRARKDEQEQLEDLNITLRGGAIAEQGAVLALAQARRDARNLKPGTDRLDQDIAINRVAEAEQRLLEVQERNQDLAGKADNANRVGIEGSEQVVAAKDRVYDAERRVTDAQQQVRLAQEATEESMTKATTAADKYEQALSKLSPAAADFVRSMRALAEEGGAWNVFQQSVQQGLFEGIGDSVSDLANTVLPKITPAMTEIARSIGGIVTTISDVLTGPAGEQLVTLLTEIPQFFTAMTPGIESTVQGFLAFGDAAAPAMTALGQGVGDVLGMIGDAFVELNDSGVLTEAISGFGDMLSGIGQWMGPLTTMFVELGAVAGPIFGDLFTIWGQTISEMTPALTIMAQVIGDVLVNDFDAFRPAIIAVTQAFSDFLVAVSPLIQPLAEMASVILTGMATNFSSLMVAMTPVIEQIAQNLEPIIPILANHMEKLTPIFADAAMILGDALVTALDELGPYLPELVQTMSDLVITIAPLLPELVELAIEVIPIVVGAASTILPIFTNVVGIFAEIATYAVPLITGALNGLEGPVGAIGGFFSTMATTVSGVWDGIINVIRGAVRAIGGLLQQVPSTISFGIGPLKKTYDFGGANDLGAAMVQWANGTVLPGNAVAESADGAKSPERMQIQRRADGGLFRGYGGPRDDANVVAISDEEYIVNAVSTAKHFDLIEAINNDELPAFKDGGTTGRKKPGGAAAPTPIVQAQKAPTAAETAASTAAPTTTSGASRGAASPAGTPVPASASSVSIIGSMEAVVGAKFPSLLQNGRAFSGMRSGDPGHHGSGHAADFSNGGDEGSPEMQGLAQFIADNYLGQTLELIHSPFDRNIKNSEYVGDGVGLYGAGTMAGHRNHVHWAVSAPVGAPGGSGAGVSGGGESNQVINASPNYSGASPYSAGNPGDAYGAGMLGANYGDAWDRADSYGDGPSDADLEKISVQAYGRKAGELGANWLLGIFGLENSILSESNVYNKAYNDTLEATKPKDPGQYAGSGPGVYTAPQVNVDGAEWMVNSDWGAGAGGTSADAGLGHVYDPAGGAEQWRSTVEAVLLGTGRSPSLAGITVQQIQIESGGDPNAFNNWDINAQNGTPSIGLIQVIKPTFDAYMDARYPGGQADPAPNIAAAFNYVDDEYGGASNIWPKVNGYKDGGQYRGRGGPREDANLIAISDEEFIVNAMSTRANLPLLEAINSGQPVMDAISDSARWSAGVVPQRPVVAAGAGLGGQSIDRSTNHTGDIITADLAAYFAERERRAAIDGFAELSRWGV
ncbi:transglycosylase SLT domain-containing protein [Rhodococcus sp. IEGM 1318]|uniref:transglycosylase SLT domain-containing protein n=1 Tax=Rhodococcus sp. IEGM 1318 TaxID=3082226 RepID=UPI0029530D4B|nr:transglycosylase SLT domain-containing protein [Rhodococcus sp. IEGM 1318]MDV8006742.1 transglycosylase SLT domain-containing protein [Rhodococcus sp. IEGM 1318]